MMDIRNLLIQRLHNQHLEQPEFQTPQEVVGWLGAMQSQEYAGAKWALGLRLPRATDTAMEKAFNEGAILRTHVMRPTWHFATPADIRWMIELTGARVIAGDAHYYRELELDEATFKRSNQVIVDAFQEGSTLTRLELSEALERAGIPAQGRRLGHILMHAELEAFICSGPRRGKQFTYMRFEDRVPASTPKPREEALAELTRRYFTSHGPATVHDFSWWSGLTIADIKIGLEMVKPWLEAIDVDGKTYWQPVEQVTGSSGTGRVLLLPPFDEFTVAYQDHSILQDPRATDPPVRPVFSGTVLVDCRLAGYWRRIFRGKTALLELAPLREFTAGERVALTHAAQRYAEFLEMPVEIGPVL